MVIVPPLGIVNIAMGSHRNNLMKYCYFILSKISVKIMKCERNQCLQYVYPPKFGIYKKLSI